MSYAWIRISFMFPMDPDILAILTRKLGMWPLVPSEFATRRRLHADPGVCEPARCEQFQKISFACLLKVA